MDSLSAILINASIRETLERINESSLQIAVVVDEENHLLGVVTDGDIRRGLLGGLSLDDSFVSSVMNKSPKVAFDGESKQSLLDRMTELSLHHLVLVDEDNKVKGIVKLDDLVHEKKIDNPVVIMAGGLGSRLYPLTKDCPKPLLYVGNKPILESILESFISYGFYKFYLSVNYKADMIKDYFEDGSKWGVNINYVYEDKPLKTAGALSLMDDALDEDFIVINGDVLAKLDFLKLLEFHRSNSSDATMCVRKHRITVPYGVISTDDSEIMDIKEKPSYDFMVNSGIYVLSPCIFNSLKRGEPLDMPDLFRRLKKEHLRTMAYSLSDYWIDIGSHKDFERAQNHFEEQKND